MLHRIVAVVAAFGIVVVAFGVGWRYVCPRLVERTQGDDLAFLAIRDGVAAAFVAVGVGFGLTALGTLGVLGTLAEPETSVGPLVALGARLPARRLGGLLLVGGFGLLVGSLLVPVGVELRNRLRG